MLHRVLFRVLAAFRVLDEVLAQPLRRLVPKAPRQQELVQAHEAQAKASVLEPDGADLLVGDVRIRGAGEKEERAEAGDLAHLLKARHAGEVDGAEVAHVRVVLARDLGAGVAKRLVDLVAKVHREARLARAEHLSDDALHHHRGRLVPSVRVVVVRGEELVVEQDADVRHVHRGGSVEVLLLRCADVFRPVLQVDEVEDVRVAPLQPRPDSRAPVTALHDAAAQLVHGLHQLDGTGSDAAGTLDAASLATHGRVVHADARSGL